MGVSMQNSIYQLDQFFECEIMTHDHETLKFLGQDIETLAYLYPEIKSWYWNIFAKGFEGHEREILIAKEKSGQLAGFSLLKNTFFEKKICTFYILPEFRESGLGRKLLPVAIDVIGGKDIGITVSESVDKFLKPLLLSNGFEFESIESGLYLPQHKEIFYKLD
ncbi:hypothetical protein D3C80_737490 [compost metagenome]